MLKQDSQLREFLSNIKLWRGLPAEQVEQLAKIAIAQTYSKGEIIFQAGDEGSGFFIVVSGRVKVYKTSAEGKEQILHLFGAGDHFAEVPAFDGQNFPASAMALETSELLFFPRTSFLNLLQEQPTLAIKILGVFARHLRIMAQLVEDLSLKEVPGRLATYLLYLSDRNNSSDLVELDMTKSQLAALLGTIPETLSRVFAKLSAEDIISTNGSKIKLLDRQRLIGLAGGLKI
ncbi:Crp/Fnr family transcriptional regulator [Microseira sp. BLCC-F43]|uniref:Crp/Fnr family transcriptional regulator n=1 Tax=Microseira sp. BLCC-F43 TaxID=3153602 RepID=UPI0035B8D3C4